MPTKKDTKKTKKSKKSTPHNKLRIKFDKKQMSLADFIRKYYTQLQTMIQEQQAKAPKPAAKPIARAEPSAEEFEHKHDV